MFYESNTVKFTSNRIIKLYSKYVQCDGIIFDLFNSSCGMYSIPKESKYTVVNFSINNETQCVLLLCLPLIFISYAPSFILDKLFLEKRH